MTNAYKIAQQYVGPCLDFDGYPPEQPYQCVDLVMIVAKQFGFELWGNGNQIGTIGDISSFADVIPYTSGILSLEEEMVQFMVILLCMEEETYPMHL